MSTNIMHVSVNGVMTRIPPHACQCDECKLLDAQDFESLRIAHQYLDEKLSLDDWRDAHIRIVVGELDIAVHRFESAIGAKERPNDLGTMIDCLYYSFNEYERGNFDERLFRSLLEQLIEGYETRMRTVHLWHRGDPPVLSEEKP